jgi:hypothetical protein
MTWTIPEYVQIRNEAACATLLGHKELYSEALY